MKISTKFHGEIEISDADIFTFESGIPGFLDEKKFTLLPLDETPFFVLQSVTTKEVAFIMMNPFDIFPTYEIDLSQDVLDDLHIESEQDVAVFVILTVRDPFEASTANLQAPVILNIEYETRQTIHHEYGPIHDSSFLYSTSSSRKTGGQINACTH